MDEPTTEPTVEGATRSDLFSGWNWGALLLPVIAEHLPDDFDAETYTAKINEEMAPLLETIEKTLENRANEATIDERVHALEKKILMLRLAHELLFATALHRTEELRKRQAARSPARRSRSGKQPDADPAEVELAQLRTRRLRLLGQ